MFRYQSIDPAGILDIKHIESSNLKQPQQTRHLYETFMKTVRRNWHLADIVTGQLCS